MDMPFFSLDEDGELQVSPQLGIYFAFVVPLTAFTILVWRWERRKRMRKRDNCLTDDCKA